MWDSQHGILTEKDALDLAAAALGARPARIVRQSLSDSGNIVWRIDLPSGESAVLRASAQPNTFTFTKCNLQVLRILGLPVQSVLASGRVASGGSYIFLNWIPGRDLIHELATMSRPRMTRLAEQIIECQRRIALSPKSHGFGWAPIGQPGPLQKWTDMFGGTLRPSDADDGTPFGSSRARLCRLRGRLERYFSTIRPTPFLDDLTTKNILIHEGQLSGIIDVDFVCRGDPLLTVGATMASVAADLPTSAAFYCDELVRLSNPTAIQRLAIWLYAALWAMGSLSLTDSNTRRARRLHRAAESWLSLAERDSASAPRAVEEQFVVCP
jgi:aminoglycoside phosphotransferase